MNRLLNALGLMTRAEHERLLSEQDNRDYKAWRKVADERDDMKMPRDDMAHKYKKAITDLAAARDEIEEWKKLANDLGAVVEATKDDAAAMRRKRQMDRDRKKGKS